MNKLLIALAVLALSGCAVVDAYFMTKYDSNEYRIVAEIRNNSQALKSGCDDQAQGKTNAIEMARQTALFEIYSENIPKNDDGFKAAKSLNEIAQGLVKRYQTGEKVSPAFCRIKFDSIEHSSGLIQSVVAKRPR